MGAVYAIRILTACALTWLVNTDGEMATFQTEIQCLEHAQFLHNHGQDAECLMIPRGE